MVASRQTNGSIERGSSETTSTSPDALVLDDAGTL